MKELVTELTDMEMDWGAIGIIMPGFIRQGLVDAIKAKAHSWTDTRSDEELMAWVDKLGAVVEWVRHGEPGHSSE